ncbi:MAG: hypothetical protein HQL93_09500, partial [Magnetococcales bacterium]|nr:hypothetical protein [Magnetococcales bacterium]
MAADRIRVLLETVTRLYHKQTLPHLENLLQKTSEADLFALFRLMGHEERSNILPLLARDTAVRIFQSLRLEDRIRIVEIAEVRDILPIIEDVSLDDQQTILSRIKGPNRNPLTAAIAINQHAQSGIDDSMMSMDEIGGQTSEIDKTEAEPSSSEKNQITKTSQRKTSAFNPEKAQILTETIIQLHE